MQQFSKNLHNKMTQKFWSKIRFHCSLVEEMVQGHWVSRWMSSFWSHFTDQQLKECLCGKNRTIFNVATAQWAEIRKKCNFEKPQSKAFWKIFQIKWHRNDLWRAEKKTFKKVDFSLWGNHSTTQTLIIWYLLLYFSVFSPLWNV